MDRLRSLRDQWALGVAALLAFGLSCLAFALLAYLAVLALALALDPGMSEEQAQSWVLIASVVWLPLGAGLGARLVGELMRRVERDREREPESSSLYG